MNQVVTSNHNKVGGFAKGNKAGVGSGQGKATAKQLKQLCIDVLNKRGVSGKPMITEVLETVGRDKPEALLPFIGKIIPQESEVTTTKFSPIVLTSDIGAKPVEGVVVEQKVIATNAEPEPVVIDTRPVVDTHTVVEGEVVPLPKKRKRIKQVLDSCSVDDEEL